MAQTFSDRIEGFVGTLTMSSVDMEDVLAEEARILYDLATPDMLAKESIYDVRTDATLGTFTVEDKRIVSVLRNDGSYDRLCAEVAFEMLGPMGDSASIHYASKRNPVFALQPKQNLGATERSTGIQVQPTPTATETVKIRYVAYPTSLYGATADNLVDFLRKIANALVYKGCIAEITSRISASTLEIKGLSYSNFFLAMSNGDIELAQSYLAQVQTEMNEGLNSAQTLVAEKQNYDALYAEELKKIGIAQG
jgi:hypothetical protein